MQEMMGAADIAFPHLGIYLTDVPKTLYIGSFSIAIYGIIIALSMLLGIVMAAKMAPRLGVDPDKIWDISVWIIIFAIVGARIYYVIFFWDFYKDDPLQIFNLRRGGLAIYGGIIACVILIIVYSKKHGISWKRMLDTIMFGLVLGQITGRWGKFFNREVFGEYTDSLLAMRLPVEAVREMDISASIAEHMQAGTNFIQVHPTFLYESLWNIGVLLIMLWFVGKRKFDGEITLLYFTGYGIGRAWIEFIRTDQLYITGTKIPVSMALSIVLVVFCVLTDIVVRRKLKKDDILKNV